MKTFYKNRGIYKTSKTFQISRICGESLKWFLEYAEYLFVILHKHITILTKKKVKYKNVWLLIMFVYYAIHICVPNS